MKGDFTRDSFDPMRDFTRVMMQQGRPQLDADWNEQVAIFWESWRNFTSDLIGPHAGPERDCGFWILAEGDFPLPAETGLSQEAQKRLLEMMQGPGDFLIGPGAYYVAGIRCASPRWVTYSNQPNLPDCPLLEKRRRFYLIYLDVWERHITDVEDDSIREVALIGVDTCTRSKLVWQVRSFELWVDEKDEKEESAKEIDCEWVRERWSRIVHHWQSTHRGYLRARTVRAVVVPSEEPMVSPISHYRGLTNQLYRVEIHRGGNFTGGERPTFKVSRENGSVVFPVLGVTDPVVTVGNLGRDSGCGLQVGDWVEVLDDAYVLQGRAEPLRQVEKIDSGRMQVTLSGKASSTVGQNLTLKPHLRRWDHKQGDPAKGGLQLQDGAAVIVETEEDRFWLTLENGIQIQFRKSEEPNQYRTGDYWLIPARTAIGDVQWKRRNGEPVPLGPHGVQHHYAPLALVTFSGGDVLETQSDCRRKFELKTKY